MENEGQNGQIKAPSKYERKVRAMGFDITEINKRLAKATARKNKFLDEDDKISKLEKSSAICKAVSEAMKPFLEGKSQGVAMSNLLMVRKELLPHFFTMYDKKYINAIKIEAIFLKIKREMDLKKTIGRGNRDLLERTWSEKQKLKEKEERSRKRGRVEHSLIASEAEEDDEEEEDEEEEEEDDADYDSEALDMD